METITSVPLPHWNLILFSFYSTNFATIWLSIDCTILCAPTPFLLSFLFSLCLVLFLRPSLYYSTFSLLSLVSSSLSFSPLSSPYSQLFSFLPSSLRIPSIPFPPLLPPLFFSPFSLPFSLSLPLPPMFSLPHSRFHLPRVFLPSSPCLLPSAASHFLPSLNSHNLKSSSPAAPRRRPPSRG